jgi:hypothetical protein
VTIAAEEPLARLGEDQDGRVASVVRDLFSS